MDKALYERELARLQVDLVSMQRWVNETGARIAVVFEGRKHYFLVEFAQEPGALRQFLDDVLGPDDDITLFEYVKRNNRETGPALVGIELADAADLPGLLERMAAAPSTIEHLSPDSPLTRFLV